MSQGKNPALRSELAFTDAMDGFLINAKGIVDTVMAALERDDDHSHLWIALSQARLKIADAEALSTEWWEKVARPASVERKRLEREASEKTHLDQLPPKDRKMAVAILAHVRTGSPLPKYRPPPRKAKRRAGR